MPTKRSRSDDVRAKIRNQRTPTESISDCWHAMCPTLCIPAKLGLVGTRRAGVGVKQYASNATSNTTADILCEFSSLRIVDKHP